MGGASNYYRPTQALAYSAIYFLRGFDPFSFHLLMVLLHLGTTLQVYRGLSLSVAVSPARLVPLVQIAQ